MDRHVPSEKSPKSKALGNIILHICIFIIGGYLMIDPAPFVSEVIFREQTNLEVYSRRTPEIFKAPEKVT